MEALLAALYYHGDKLSHAISIDICSSYQAVSKLSKFLSLCEEVMDLEHLQETRHVRVRPSFHEELNRLGQEIDHTRDQMTEVLRDVEKESKVRVIYDGRVTI